MADTNDLASQADEKPAPLLKTLKSRLNLAVRWHKKWFEEVKKAIKSYEIDSLDDITQEDLYNKLQIPYIFSTIESDQPAMFNTFPSLTLKGRGKNDEKFGDFVDGVWEYVYDKTSLEEKVENAGLMFLVTGMGQIARDWVTETETVEEPTPTPVTNSDGTPVVDGMGQPVTHEVINRYEVPVKDQPVIRFLHYDRVFYSPESEFVVDDTEDQIPYVIEEVKMSPDEIKEKYGKTVKAQTFMDLKDIDEKLTPDSNILDKNDIKRIKVYIYQGILPQKVSSDPNWKSNYVYRVVFTLSQILAKPERLKKKQIYQVGNYGIPTKFFKFGEPKVLSELERDVSAGRSTLIDYRDKFATKIAIPSDTEVDERALKSPKKFAIVKFNGNQPPTYITPPPLPETIIMGINQSRSDIQMASSQIDVSKGGMESTVDTATGQKIFQAAQDRRIERKRKKIAAFIEAIARDVLAECGEKWDVETFAKIVDVDTANPDEVMQLQDFVERLKTIGDQFDIEIEPESVVSNKATDGAQAIAMYREMKDDPIVNRARLVEEAIRRGFGKKNTNEFLNTMLTPEQLQQALELLIQIGAIDEATAAAVMAQVAPGAAGQGPGQPSQNTPVGDVQNSMPAADSTQVDAQNEAAYKQAGVPKGPQGVK